MIAGDAIEPDAFDRRQAVTNRAFQCREAISLSLTSGGSSTIPCARISFV